MVTEHEDETIRKILKKMKQMGYPEESIRYAQIELYKNPEGDFAKNLVGSMLSIGIATLIFNEVEKNKD